MAEKACIKRLQKEYRALCKEPVSHVVARPSPNDILECIVTEIHSSESGLNTSNRCFQITVTPQVLNTSNRCLQFSWVWFSRTQKITRMRFHFWMSKVFEESMLAKSRMSLKKIPLKREA